MNTRDILIVHSDANYLRQAIPYGVTSVTTEYSSNIINQQKRNRHEGSKY